MSPKSGGRAQRRQRRNLLISVIVVVAISVGSFAGVVAVVTLLYATGVIVGAMNMEAAF